MNLTNYICKSAQKQSAKARKITLCYNTAKAMNNQSIKQSMQTFI
jgi:hypothetical protein